MGTPTIGVPGLTLPVGTVPGRMTAIQLLATRFGDRRLLEAGAVLECVIGRIVPIDPDQPREKSTDINAQPHT